MKEKKQREPHDKAFITAGLFLGVILFIIHICKTHQYWAFTFVASIALIVAVPFLVYAETAHPNRAKLLYDLSQIALWGAGVVFLIGAIWWSVDQMKKRHKAEA